MFETTKVLIKQNTRSLISKMKESPVLYIVFTIMMIFSVVIFAFITYFLQIIETKLDVQENFEEIGLCNDAHDATVTGYW